MKKLTIIIASLVALTVAIESATKEAITIVSFFIIFNPFVIY